MDKEQTVRKSSAPMPVWRKAPPELAAFYKALVVDYPQLEQRMMFGYPCAMVNGYLTTGIFADRMFVRLDKLSADELLAVPGAASMEPSPGRIMKGYVLLPEDIRTSPKVHVWLQRAIDYSSSLPRKVKKSRKTG
ncbi:MAG: TfoX/Sxy family protein [Chloroflexi bacterium]|nr:TfoX/Sxy family protein [Chloroflexota bacterium]